jgi:tetratricopeptide (TPR) repeat protein
MSRLFLSRNIEDGNGRAGHLNRAACSIALERYQDAADDCSAALRLMEGTGHALLPKAYFRRGQALSKLQYVEGRDDLKAAFRLKPDDRAILKAAKAATSRAKQDKWQRQPVNWAGYPTLVGLPRHAETTGMPCGELCAAVWGALACGAGSGGGGATMQPPPPPPASMSVLSEHHDAIERMLPAPSTSAPPQDDGETDNRDDDTSATVHSGACIALHWSASAWVSAHGSETEAPLPNGCERGVSIFDAVHFD